MNAHAPSFSVLICTKDRPERLARLLVQLRDEPLDVVVVVDASADDDTAGVVEQARHALRAPVVLERMPPGLSRQRNRALEVAVAHGGSDYLCFLDDDGTLAPGYFDALAQAIVAFDSPEAVGGVADDPRQRPDGALGRAWSYAKRAFFLDGPPGSITRAGWNVQLRDADEPVMVEWLQGGSMGLRRDVAERARFDERLHTYSWGEDFDLTWRLSRDGRLVQTPFARVMNELGTVDRERTVDMACRRTVLRHAWTAEHRGDHLSVVAFWWSVTGQLLLYPLLGIAGRRPGWRREVRGIAKGVLAILRGQSSRHF